MEVLKDGEKKKKFKRNSASFYEYRNSSTMSFFRVSLILLDNGKLLGIVTLYMLPSVLFSWVFFFFPV